MKTQKIIILIFIILTAVTAVRFLSAKNEERKTLPVLQHIEEARISVKAAPFKKEDIEEKSENSFKGLFFDSVHKEMQYSLTYAVYNKEPDIQSALAALEEVFKDYNFSYKPQEMEIGKNPALKIEGYYEKNGKKYGIKKVLIKKDKNLWQVFTIYPFSDKNEKAANEYIDSIVLDDSEK